MAMLGVGLLLPLYYQQVRHESALDAGVLLAPGGLGMAIALVIAGRLSDKVGPRQLVLVGLLLAGASMLVYTQITPQTSTVLLSVVLVFNGAGTGLVIVPGLTSSYRGLSSQQIPKASSTVRILQQLGGSFGVAILAVVLQHQVIGQGRHAAGLAVAYGHTFWWALGFIALAAIPALGLPRTAPGDESDHAPRAARKARRASPPLGFVAEPIAVARRN
jgi:predicted MFS family arabinose efflux permease